jgi:probable rRNA maturation factor
MGLQVLVELQNATAATSAPAEDTVRECITQAVAAVRGADSKDCELSVRFVDEDEGRLLNQRYRAQDKATNVLSFAAEQPPGLPAGAGEMLGDIVICGAVVEREARQQGKDAAGHWDHMLVHGTLHLLGFDHQDDQQATEMEALESKILAARGIHDPYLGPVE